MSVHGLMNYRPPNAPPPPSRRRLVYEIITALVWIGAMYFILERAMR